MNPFKLLISSLILISLFFSSIPAFSQTQIVFEEKMLKLRVGESEGIDAEVINAEGEEIDDAETSWSVSPANLGTFDENEFTAINPGEGQITAQYDGASASIKLVVQPQKGDDNEDDDEEENEQDADPPWPNVKIHPDTLEMELGKTKEIKATFRDSSGSKIDTTFIWWVNPDSIGSIDEFGEFTALSEGEGFIFAQLDTLVDSAYVQIIMEEEDEDDEDDDKTWPMIKIHPDTLEMEVGKTKEIKTTYIDPNGEKNDTTFTWWVIPDSIGSVDEYGEFTALTEGEAYVFAQLDTLVDSVYINIYLEEDDEEEPPFVKIITRKVKLAPADSVQLMAIYIGMQGREKDAEILWSVNPPELGTFNETGMFYAAVPGEGYIVALKDTLSDSVEVEIEIDDDKDDDDNKGNSNNNRNRLVISPKDTTVYVGESVQFQSWQKKQDGSLETTDVEWILSGDPIGTISEEGLLVIDQAGVGLVRAIKDDKEKTATVIVLEDVSETMTELNTISISRIIKDEYSLPPENLTEGQAYTIGGLPYPLDLLNGGLLYFPVGSLHEDIEIHIKLPDFVQQDSSDLDLGEGNVAAVEFNVMINGEHIEHYYFDIPLNLSIPYDAELLDSLGVDPLDIGMFFDNNDDFTSDGIQNITVDSTENKIYAQVAHFSTLVVRPNTLTTVISQDELPVAVPTRIALRQNYPNPFNPTTRIDFELPAAENVQLMVYNTLGRHIQTLYDGRKEAGLHTLNWNGRDSNGHSVASGVYFYILKTENITLQRKMILIK